MIKQDILKINSILDYYTLCLKLKDTIRTGWKRWNVSKNRLESVAEHIFGTCMLAVAIWSQTQSKLNLGEIILTLSLHETEEIIIGDITPFDNKEKQDIKSHGREQVYKVFENLLQRDYYYQLIENFDTLKTPEAIFARKCDKLECDLQAKYYDEQGYMNLENADSIKDSEIIKSYIVNGYTKVSDFFLLNDFKYYEEDDDIFKQIATYLKTNSLLKNKNI